MEKIALLPGGFKPPHAGHYNMAKWLVANTDADSVVIKIGSKERDGITRDISLKLWDLYRKADEDSSKLVIVPSESPSPVRDVYDFIEQEAPEGSTVYLGMGEKDIEDQRFKNIGKFAEPKEIEFETVLVPPQAGGVSGTEMRGFIKDGDKESFQKYLPDHLSSEQKDEAWSIVSSIKEDLYDPNDHYRDFAKTNDPNPKKPISPSYKYHRAGIYGRMYEKKLNEQINPDVAGVYIPEDAGCMQFCDPVDFEDPNNLLGEEQLLIVPICLPDYKPEDSAFIESYQFMFGYNNDILQWNQQYSQIVSQMPQLFGLSNALAGGMGIQNENQPGVVSYAFATGNAFDWSETAVLTYLVFVVTGNGVANFTWNEDAGGASVNPNLASGGYYVYGVTDCFENGSVSVTLDDESEEPEKDLCDGFNSLTIPMQNAICVNCPNPQQALCACCPTKYSCSTCNGCQEDPNGPFDSLEECQDSGCVPTNIETFNYNAYSPSYLNVETYCGRCYSVGNGSYLNMTLEPEHPNCACCDPDFVPDYAQSDPNLIATPPREPSKDPIKDKPKKEPLREQQGKTLRVYDFDDTLAVTKGANIKIKHADGSMDTLDPAEFAVYDAQEGDKFDFTEFDRVIKDAEPIQNIISMLRKDLETTAKVTILTARLIAYPVRRYLKSLDLDAYVVAVGSSDPNDKAKWIENHIEKGYTDILFIDDSEKNRNAVSNLKDKYPDIKLDVQDPDSIKEMIGTMNNQEKRKHAKNLKRLNKDLKKQGDQYMKVPDYLKGTLKRKLYKEQFFPKLHPDHPYDHKKMGHYTTSVASINNKTIPLEIMKTPDDQITGMMGRDEMKAGMIFPYDNVSKKDFHMEGCLIPLDIVFINKGTIDTIHPNCPPCKETPCPKYSGMADNVLELPGGYCKKHNINVGDKVNLNLTERKLTKGELKDRERIAKDLPDKEFKKRYGKDWKSVKLATATKMAKKEEALYPRYTADQVQKVRYQASDVFTGSPKRAKKLGYLEGDTYEKMAAKGKKKGNLKQGTVRKRLKIKAGDKIPLSKINKAISRIKKMENPSEKNKKYLKALNLAKTLKTTTHKENLYEADPKKGTGKKPKGSGRRLYTDENPKDTVKVKFSTRQDIVDTLSKKSFKSKPHKRQSQIINLIHQRVRAALSRTKDPQKKKRLKSAFEYIKKRKEASKRKTQRMKKENVFTKEWWKDTLNEILLKEGGAAGHMAHPFNLPNVNSGKDLLDVFEKSSNSLQNNPGSVKIDGVNSSIRLVDFDGEKQFVMDRGSKKELDIKGITKDDLLDRFGDGHGMVKIGGEVLDMFNEALPSIKGDLEKLGAYDDPNILFNMEYVSGKTNVQEYGSNFIAIHGLNKIETKEVQGKRKMLTKRVSSEVSYDKSALQSLLDNLAPIAKKQGFEVYGSVPTEMAKKPDFNSALSKTYTIEAEENTQTKSLKDLLNELNNIPEEDFIFMNVDNSKKKVGAVSKQVYLAILQGGNVDELFENEEDKQKAIEGFTTYLATEKLGDEILKVLDSPMGSVENHEGVVIRDEKIANVPFKITGKFILGGMVSDF